MSEAGNLLVLHWGRKGGGPRFTIRMAEALAAVWPREVYMSVHEAAARDYPPKLSPDRVFTVDTYKTPLGVLNIPRFLSAVIRTRAHIRRHDVTVVYSGMLSIWHSIGIRLLLPRGTRLISSIHDPTTHPGDEDRVLRLAKTMELSRADVVVCYSRQATASVRSQISNRKPVIYVHHGVDAPEVEAPRASPAPNRPVRLGFVGRIAEYKGVDIFVEAIAALRERGVSVVGVVSGSGAVDEKLRSAGAEFIRWDVRWIDETMIGAVFSGIDVLVLPYREASQSGVFTLGLTYGIPIVVTPMAGLIEQVNDSGAGVISRAAEPRALADAIETVLEADQYEAEARASFDAARNKLSWNRAARCLVDQSVPLLAAGSTTGSWERSVEEGISE